MDKFYTTFKTRIVVALAILLGMIGFWPTAEACNLSSFTVTSIVPGPFPDTTINATLCVGGGRTGLIRGADNDTRSFVFVFWGGGPGVNVTAFTPASVTGVPTNCTMPGADIGPMGPPYNSLASIIYIDPGYYNIPPCVNQPFACITSTALCGNINQNCINFTFRMSRLSDSVCVRGVEAGGSPFGGCPCSTMGSPLRLGAPLLVWGDLAAETQDDHVRLTWSSLQEFESGSYYVERRIGNGDFAEIGEISGSGATNQPIEYGWNDPINDMQGQISYRLRFVDQDGRAEYSPLAIVNLPITQPLAIRGISPVPASDFVNVDLLAQNAGGMDWTIVNSAGKVVGNGNAALLSGDTRVRLDIASLAPGAYYLRCRANGEMVTRKVVKQ